MKLYYISDRIYPSGNAGGIRIDYLTRMFSFLYDVSIISFNNNSKKNYIKESNSKIKVYILPLSSVNLLGKYFDRYIFSAIRAYRIIKNILTQDSIAVIYSTNIIFVMFVMLAIRNKRNIKIIFDVVENFGPNNFKFGILNPKYYLFRILYSFIYSRSDAVYAISKSIQSDFRKKGIPTFILPPLFSSTDFTNNKDYNTEVRNILYAGNPFGKENLELMFSVLTKLLQNRYHLRFHLAGISKIDLNKHTNFEKRYPLLFENTIIYDWLSIDELEKIYKSMQFTFFLRDNIQSNICNYPMKLVEMMNFGIIPIISRVGDYAEVLTDGHNAFIVEDNNSENCVNKFAEIFDKSHDELFSISNNARLASLNYDYKNFYNKNISDLISFMQNL